MSATDINRIVGELVRVRELDRARFEELLAVRIEETGGNAYWIFHEFDLVQGPFAKGELRVHVDRDKALLVLYPRGDVGRDELGLGQWGEVKSIDVNPGIPPEGTDAYIYDVLGVKVSFQFTHLSQQLRLVVLDWVIA